LGHSASGGEEAPEASASVNSRPDFREAADLRSPYQRPVLHPRRMACMALKPWYRVVTPREDLREGKPLDASEFAVHLDQVRDGLAPADYQKPERFFERTYLTKNLASLASEVVRRLSGEK